MAKKEISNQSLNKAGKAMLVQKHQKFSVEGQLGKIESSLEDLSKMNTQNLDTLDSLLLQAESLSARQGIEPTSILQEDINNGLELMALTEEEKSNMNVPQFDMLDTVEVSDDISWDEYLNNIETYAEKNDIDLSRDPFEDLMTESERAKIAERIRTDYTMKKAHCDKYDYLIAVFCGVATGLIDSFFVGMPKKSKLGKWTNNQTDKLVEKFATMVWKSDQKNGIASSRKEPVGIASAIGYLERRFRVNYDARYTSDLQLGDNVLNISPKDHHLKSLGHSPDLIGLFFSILDQFTGKASFVSDGKIVRVTPIERNPGFVLSGDTFFAKLFCGFCNWIGHIMSDLAGSSGTRGHANGKVGAGVPVPFFEMFMFCDFGSFNIKGEQKNFAELMTKVYESGYDARHGATMAIPVILNELLIRLLWAIKSRFYHEHSWKESIPFGNRPELRRMLVVGHGTLCLVDGVDAAIRSWGNPLDFALHLNMIAWAKFAFSALQEIRAIYKSDCLDIESMDKALEIEWHQLYGEIVT